MPDEKLSHLQECRKTIDAALPFWKTRWEAMDALEDFVNGDRYEDDHGAYIKDRRLVQIRGQEIQDTHRHVAAKVTEKPRSVEARPRDRETDPDTGEIAATLVEAELSDPWKDFDGKYEAAIISAREKRMGVVMMDWEPDCGPFGSILYRYVDPRRVMWDPSYEDPHDPMCPWFCEIKRMDVDRARKVYKKPWLQADRDSLRTDHQRTGQPITRDRHAARDNYEDNKVTLRCVWYKNDKTEGKYEERDYAELEPDKRYMVCQSGCGYRSETEGDLKRAGVVDKELPEMIEGMVEDEDGGACPICGGNLERVDAKAQDAASLAYTEGHRLLIDAPFSQGPNEDEAVYDGDWPIPEARSFPCLIITAYQKPGEPVGPCDTDLMWDQQLASDHLRTMAVQRVFEHRNYWELPRDGIYNHSGRRFGFRDDDFNVMYRDYSKTQMGGEVKVHVGTGLDPNFMTAFNITQQALTQYRGVTDLGITQESSKNIAASTVAQLNQMGEIPTAHFKRRLNRALAKWYGIVWDYIRATYTEQRLSRLNIDGIDMVAPLSGDDMPNFDFVLMDTPDFTGVEKAKSEAFQALTSLMVEAPDMVEVFAEVNNLPRSVVRKVQKVLDERKALAMEAENKRRQAEAMGAIVPGEDEAIDPELEEMAGLQQVPGYARGTRSQPGGTAIVGEDGPELVNLAPNTPVLPLGRMRDSLMQAAEYLGTFGGLVPKVGLKQVADMALGAPVEPMPRDGSFADKLAWAASVPGVMPIGAAAFHGTPHKFPPTPKNPLGEFDLSKIGTGEGAQAYGHGIYVAENPAIAKHYQAALSNRGGEVRRGGQPIASHGHSRLPDTSPQYEHAAVAALGNSGSVSGAIKSLEDVLGKYSPESRAAYQHFKNTGEIRHPGFATGAAGERAARKQFAQMDFVNEQIGWIKKHEKDFEFPDPGATYTVDLPDEHIANMLDWDSKLSSQPENVRAAVVRYWRENRLPGDPSGLSGEGIYGSIQAHNLSGGMSRAAAADAASTDLKSLGIPGIKYLDATSRSAGKGTRNFVVFDPSITKITGVE